MAVRQADVFAWLKTSAARGRSTSFSPTRRTGKQPTDSDFAAALLASPVLPGLLADDGVFVLESHGGPGILAIPPAWRLLDQRTYGTSRISFLEARKKPTAARRMSPGAVRALYNLALPPALLAALPGAAGSK